MVKFSVMVPFADDAATLGACLERILSAIARLSREAPSAGAELICVNGGATAECLTIAKEYAAKFPLIKLWEGEEPGPGRARNRALAMATGEYAVFVDADDFIDEDALTRLKDVKDDIVTFLPPAGEFDLTRDADRARAFSPMVGNLLVWNAIYRRERLGDLCFPALGNYEDLVFTAGAFARASSLTAGMKPWYEHTFRAGSAANRHTFRRVKDGMVATRLIWKNCRTAHVGLRTRFILARKLAMHLILHVALEAVKALWLRRAGLKPLAASAARSFLVDARTFSAAPTGIGMYAYRRVRKLMTENPMARFTLVCDVDGGSEIAELRAAGAEVRVYGKRVYNSFAVLGYLRFAGKIARELKPDVFWQPNNLQPFKVKGAKRTIVTIHDIFPLEEFSLKNWRWHLYWRWAFERTLANAEVLEYNSEATKKIVEARSARARKLSGRVEYPVTLVPRREEIRPYRREREYFLYVGNIETRKGTDVLIEAFRRYREQGGRLDLVMAGKMRNVAVPKLAGLEYLGYVDEAIKFELMVAARALVVPSRQEGYGMQVAEAAALGVKQIISNLPVFAEIKAKNAIFVPPGDIKAWTQALISA